MHDFWYNILDNDEKLNFSIEAEIWYRSLDKNSKEYKILSSHKKHYSDKKFFGTELYSKIAEEVYNNKFRLPKPLEQFYEKVLE